MNFYRYTLIFIYFLIKKWNNYHLIHINQENFFFFSYIFFNRILNIYEQPTPLIIFKWFLFSWRKKITVKKIKTTGNFIYLGWWFSYDFLSVSWFFLFFLIFLVLFLCQKIFIETAGAKSIRIGRQADINNGAPKNCFLFFVSS